MILLIDNYDSFTFNLMHLVAGLGETVDVIRNDKITAAEALALQPEAVVLSPGPKTPDYAGISLELIGAAADAGVPVFGVCLGMQSIAQAFGGRVEQAGRLMHGKTCKVVHENGWMFDGLPSPLEAARYHSLVAARTSLPDCFAIDAVASDDNEIMAIRHRDLPIAGVQFHPESIASEHGPALIANFLKRARQE
ncbi:MAG: aminodeoxychorismate/anthranilate synthase component II [Pseudomonadota bacterium]